MSHRSFLTEIVSSRDSHLIQSSDPFAHAQPAARALAKKYPILERSAHLTLASSPGESHPEALSDPYVTLSRHTAPVIQRYSQLPSSGETVADQRPSSCAATAYWHASCSIRLCTCDWPTVQVRVQYAHRAETWLLDRTHLNSSTILG
jgi:hypothetical protein